MQNVHFLGITGSGASAVAAIAKAEGFEVTGCDIQPSHEFIKNFAEFSVQTGHSPDHLKLGVSQNPQVSIQNHPPGGHDQKKLKIDILVVTPAVFSFDPNNNEVAAAKKLGIEVLTWQEFMGKYLQKDKFVIAVCGTHGKSTVTAMIGQMLEDAGLDPTVELGATVPRWKANYRIPLQTSVDRHIFVTEADEFNDNFLFTKPDIAVVTNIEMDHPEYFKDLNDVKKSFEKFLLRTKQTIVANIADPHIAEILKDVMKESKVPALDYSKHELNLPLQIPGDFNQLNAQAAFQVGLLLGIDPQVIRKSLASFTGIGRRFERLGEYKGREVYSDFAHHPTEIRTTMVAARKKWPDKYIWLIFQPHLFSRTKGLFKEFVEVFKNLPVNQALIMDIYPSREVDTGSVNSKQLVEAIDEAKVDYISGVEELKEVIDKEIRPGDILFFMGAGNIDQIARKLVVKN